MSKVFRRPMFRGGSTNMNGIMSGIEDRKNYANGPENPAATPVSAGDRYKEIYDKYAQPTIDPLGKYLIASSLRGFSETGGGSTLGNLGLAFGGENLNQLFSDIEGQRTSARDMELAKLGYDIEDEKAKEAIAREDLLLKDQRGFDQSLLNQEIQAKNNLAQLKREFEAAEGDADRQNKIAVEIQKGENKIAELQFKKDNPEISKEFAAQTPEEQFKVFSGIYERSNKPPIKNNASVLASFKIRHANQPYYELNFEYSNKSKKYEPDFSTIPLGALTFDPTQGKAYRRNQDGSLTELSPIDLSPLDVDGTE
jgi:hypothetical protein